MEHYQVILAYDGSRYQGFQRQANARTVQGVVEEALRKLNWHGKSILAAGRTDTGTHATGQVIAFALEWRHSTQELLLALNDHLPSDVVAKDVKTVCASFHPRFDASWRRYLYRIYCQPVREPLLEPYAWRIWPAPDLQVLQAAARSLIGTHDFASFGTSPQSSGNTVRRVLKADWKVEEPYLVFNIAAQAFLYHMVRRMVFIQIAIGQGKLDPNELTMILSEKSIDQTVNVTEKSSGKRLVHGLAPAQGLILAEVNYPEAIFGS